MCACIAGLSGVIAFAIFIDISQFAADIAWIDNGNQTGNTSYVAGFGLFTGAWILNFIAFFAVLAVKKAE